MSQAAEPEVDITPMQRAAVYVYLGDRFSWPPSEIALIPEPIIDGLWTLIESFSGRRHIPGINLDEAEFKRAVEREIREYVREHEIRTRDGR